MKQNVFLVSLFVIAVFALTSCDSLWDHKAEKPVEISFTIPQEWLEEFEEERASVQSMSRAGLYTSISATVSIHNANTDEVWAKQTVYLGDSLSDTITFEKLYIVGEAVYAQIEFMHEGYKPRIEKSDSIVVKEGLNRLEFVFGGLVPIDIESSTVGKLIGIPGGTYMFQGTAGGNVALQENVIVANFNLGETEVTQGQWLDVMGTWPGADPTLEKGLGDNKPAYNVSWNDAVEFCNTLSEKENLSPYYESDGTIIGGTGYRLPTEREWEYAAGHGGFSLDGAAKERTIYAGTDTDLGSYAWYKDNANATTHIVGTAGRNESLPTEKTGNANALGLYDMSGNVWEWCYDTPLAGSTNRVYRGGHWNNTENNLTVSNRVNNVPTFRDASVGFRVARSAAP